MSSQYGELRPTNGWDPLASLGHPCKFQRVSRLGSVTARQSSSRRQPNFAALNRGRHLRLAGRPSRWALAHILVGNLEQVYIFWDIIAEYKQMWMLCNTLPASQHLWRDICVADVEREFVNAFVWSYFVPILVAAVFFLNLLSLYGYCKSYISSFSTNIIPTVTFTPSVLLTLLVWGHPACKNWVVRYWCGYLSGVQMICIWSSWCHCPPIISCSSKIQNGLPFWCRLTQVVLEKRPLNGCSSSYAIIIILGKYSSLSYANEIFWVLS